MTQLDRCPVCLCDRITLDYEGTTSRAPDGKTWRVDRCEGCSHGFINPQPSWEELTPYYGESYPPYEASHGASGEDVEVVRRARESGSFRHVEIRPGMRVLDYGCGAGFFLRIARELGAEVRGIEPSPIGAQRAREAGIDVCNGDSSDFVRDFPDERFDLITANHVIEHVPDPVKTLGDLRGLLAPNGTLWIAVPNAESDDCRSLGSAWHSTDLPIHLMQFRRESLRRASERAGLTEIDSTTSSLPRGVADSIRTHLSRRYFLPRRLTRRIAWIETRYAPKQARRLDANGRGEAILARYRVRQ